MQTGALMECGAEVLPRAHFSLAYIFILFFYRNKPTDSADPTCKFKV
jgi:hypothetical protein